MANQSVSNERKRELEQMDPFQEKMIQAARMFGQYKKQIMIGIGAVLMVVFIFYGIMYSFKRSEMQAAAISNNAQALYAETNDPAKGYEAVREDFDRLFTEYGNTPAGRQARMPYAKICFDAGKFEESDTHYKEALELFKHDAGLENLILAALGNVSLAMGKMDEATQYFERIETGHSDLLKDEARYTLGMIYEAQKTPEKSLPLYEQIIEKSTQSLYTAIAKSRVAQLK